MYLTQSLHRALQQRADKPMAICGDRMRTTREVADRVARLAGGMRALGVAPDDRVAVLALNSDRYHETFYAAWWIGAAVNPVNIRWSPAEISYALDDAGATVLFVDDAFLAHVPDLRAACPKLRVVVHCGDTVPPPGMVGYEALIADAEPVDDIRRGGDAVAALLYTGGTTGRPKGVMVSHQGLMTAAIGGQMCTGSAVADGVNLVAAPLFHIAAIYGWLGQNLMGGVHVFLPSFSPESVLEAIHKHRVTTLTLVPTMLQMVVDHPTRRDYDLSSVWTAGYGGSVIPEAVLTRALEAFPNGGLVQGYGMTETALISSLGREDHRTGGRLLRSAGRSTAQCEVRVIGADGCDLPPGATGEIVVRGDTIMLGYWNQPDETAATVRDGWMHTGDAGYLDEDGYLYVVDRVKDMIISGGENVYSAEVENVLAGHPAVAACAVIGLPDDKWGERVHAVVVLQTGARATEDEIRNHVRDRIAGYKAPRSVEFVESLPTSGAGKILKRDLREQRTSPTD
ncbi:acyl-CoA synthetase [Yinghuangia soli]|uniref:Long-chain fatty acid--CoA ligase n=1 Tax=Yinghuangia soli TaxID=2908204 RepID=A0AA41U7E0_9ACTN|nr:long-chain fatty acid--CoA ligase [Yinghuangia soli]MCF2533957.1 long-chain fatty acid--CoA ligase [Yinghuangia soli]